MKNLNALVLFSCIFLFSALSFAQTVHVVEVRNFVFVPESLNIAVNDTVEWQWIEGTHTTTSDSTTGQNVWNAPIDASHQVFRFVITASGNHDYYCIPHQSLGMVGTIIATPVTGIEAETHQLDKFQLNQNYPNPFNPTTTIRYTLASTTTVKLEVFNLQGQSVATLVNRVQSAGNYQLDFDAGNLSSGIYFCRLKTSTGISEIRKMQLVR